MRISVGMLEAILNDSSANTKVYHLFFRVMFPKMYTPLDITPNPTENTMWFSIPQFPPAHKLFTVCQVCQSLKINGWGWWSLFFEGSRWPLLVSKKSAVYCGSRTAVTSGILLPPRAGNGSPAAYCPSPQRKSTHRPRGGTTRWLSRTRMPCGAATASRLTRTPNNNFIHVEIS